MPEVTVKRSILVFLCASLLIARYARGQETCSAVPKADPRWEQIDGQYARIEQAMMAKDAKRLFAVYAPDFEVHAANAEVTSFKQSADYVNAGFNQVKENLSISNILMDLQACGPGVVKGTVLQQWYRRQMSLGKLRLYQTATVQDETWILREGEWKRKLIDNIRPGAWLVDLKRVDPTKPFDPDAPPFDPHGLFRIATHAN
jgi:hypothetical protein